MATTKKSPRKRTPKSAPKRDIYQDVTDSIVAALERAGEWQRPWTELGTDTALPRSIDGRPYRGVNVLLLWASALDNGYEHGVWGTYNAWSNHGAQVRKGEHGTMVTLWKPTNRKASADEVAGGKADDDGRVDSLLLRSFTVFNSAQVDGWEPPALDIPDGPAAIDHADEFFTAIGADVEYRGNRAYYSPGVDAIVIPKLAAFIDAEHFYATVAHEHAHWTGHASRLARDFHGRFGSEAYAFEELVAELSAAFTGAHLGIGSHVRDDHAAYVKNWLRVLRDDKKAVFTAASHAQKATDYLIAAAGLDDASTEKVLVSS